MGAPQVGTHPLAKAQAALRRRAAESGGTITQVEDGGIVLSDPTAPRSAYLAYPGANLEIELRDPVRGRAVTMVHSGLIEPVG